MNDKTTAALLFSIFTCLSQSVLAETIVARVSAVEGKAWIRSSSEMFAAEPDLSLSAGDRLLTGANSKAVIVQDECTMILGALAHFQVSEAAPCPEGVAFLAIDGVQVHPANGTSTSIYADTPPPPPPPPTTPSVPPAAIGLSAYGAVFLAGVWNMLTDDGDDPISP